MSDEIDECSEAPERAPTRSEIETRWRALIAGEISREEIHHWVKPWVEECWEFVDPSLTGVLQTLHGFDLTRDPLHPSWYRHGGHEDDRPYVHSNEHVWREFERWRARLAG